MGHKNPEGGKPSELSKIREKRAQRQNGGIADWASADPAVVLQAIAVVSFRGGALRFGYSRDGGAYAIGIYLSDDRYTEYVRPSEDIDEYLRGLAEDLNGSPANT